MKMKFLYITDIHGHISIIKKLIEKERAEDFDAVIIGGDVTDFGPLELGIKILKILSSRARKVLFVPGNCDPLDLINLSFSDEIIPIHGSVYRLHDVLSIGGIGGSNITPFNTLFEWSEEYAAKLLHSIGNKVRKGIFVSHAPPFKTKLDITRINTHAGSKTIREFIEKTGPLVALTGHIHESRGKDYLGKTLIINPGPLVNGYYAVIEITGSDTVMVQFRTI